MHEEMVRWHKIKLHLVVVDLITIHTSEKYDMGRLTIAERGIAVGFINAGIHQTEVRLKVNSMSLIN